MVLRRLVVLLPFLFLAVALAGFDRPSTQETTLYDAVVYGRDRGKPQTVSESFAVADAHGTFTLVVQNGDPDTKKHRVSSGQVLLNGAVVAATRDFSKKVDRIERSVTLERINQIEVEVRGKPGSYLSLWILGEPCGPRIQADAGPDQTVAVGTQVQLDGKALTFGDCGPDQSPEDQDSKDDGKSAKHDRSRDDGKSQDDDEASEEGTKADNFPLSFEWRFLDLPAGSQATLSDPAQPDLRRRPAG